MNTSIINDGCVFLDQLENKLESIHIELAKTRWKQVVEADNQSATETIKLEEKISQILLDKMNLEKIRYFMKKIDDSHNKRRLFLLEKRILSAQVKNVPEIVNLERGLKGVISMYKPVVSGKGLTYDKIDCILKSSPDKTLRKKAWYSYSTLGKLLQADLRRFLKMRNESARKLGYETYIDLILDERGLTRFEVLKLFDQFLASTQRLYEEYLEDTSAMHRISSPKAWDVLFLMEKVTSLHDKLFPSSQIPKKAQELAQSIGLHPRYLKISVGRPGITLGGLCLAIDVPRDIRIAVANPKNGYRWYLRFFHEYGHGLYYSSINQSTYSLKYLESPCFVEAMGIIFERVASTYEWLANCIEMPESEVHKFLNAQKKYIIYDMRNLIAECELQYRVYEDPSQDLDQLWNCIVEKTMGFTDPESKRWIKLLHHVNKQDYFIGHIVASQTLSTLKRKYGYLIGNQQIGSILIEEYFRPGASIDWRKKIKGIIGELDSHAFAKELSSDW